MPPDQSASLPLTQRLRTWARAVKRDGVALWFACRHPDTPWYVKALGAFVVAYALSPIDLVPDFIPVLGYIDDVLLLPALIWLAVRLMPAAVLASSREQASAWMAASGAKPRSRWGVVLVVSVWAVVAYGIWRWLGPPPFAN
ncbi:hypothetical protein D9X30_0510 [Cupriavidus sp. U2]|uniref:YkvA family protein n=1 Tax=Cupriavidus sp. U2 TaxID=2920269 RepID=UPI00129E294E|nr:YkvA family protein [Cupriavidus sp. U2]KAI3594278.1 hypothetical protein D9X30_0510 [Cupriavidus sp. U2]